MFFCPLQSKGAEVGLLHNRCLLLIPPKITQKYGENVHRYPNDHGFGHSGIDYHTWVGREIFAPFAGEVKVMDRGDQSYGLHVRIRNKYGYEAVLAHVSAALVKNGDMVEALDRVALVGNTGKSRKPHLHFGIKRLVVSEKPIFEWRNKKSDVSAYGYIDPLPLIVNWKAGQFNSQLSQ